MTIRRIDPDEAVNINGFPITAWQLAEARQELSHRGVHNPRWNELSRRDRETAAISAAGWLRALAELVNPDELTDLEAWRDARIKPMAAHWHANVDPDRLT